MDTSLSRLRFEIRNIFRTECGNQAKVSSMTAYRFTEEIIYMPQIDNPYLYIVLDLSLIHISNPLYNRPYLSKICSFYMMAR